MTTNRTRLPLSLAVAALIGMSPSAGACTRATYLGPEGTVVTGRTMDWMVPLHTNLWAFPAGLARDGAAGAKPLRWTSNYGSVVAAGYDAGTADGMNEKGLVANLLYLGAADFGTPDAARPGLSVLGWAQYVLDNFATVAEAVDALRTEAFQVVGVTLPGGFGATLHLAISDPSGDSAILEYLYGKLVIHHGRQYQVMTNDPSFDQQLALNAYWKEIGGQAMLPGTERAADRFVRASYYLGGLPQTADPVASVAGVFSLMRTVSVPFGVTTPDAPNIAPTLWRTVADQKHRIYYFDSSDAPNVFWVDMSRLNLATGQPTRKLEIGGQVLAGEVSNQFKEAAPFTFMSGAGH